METVLIMMFLSLPIFVEHMSDPAANLWQTKEEARNVECVRMPQAAAHALYPARIPEPPARRTIAETDAMICTPRMVRHGERPARDEAILSGLSRSVAELTEAAVAAAGGALTWHVDAFYPEPRVASKITIAARTELAEGGSRVSDRVPLLAAGDIAVLSGLAPKDAYPLACSRYFAQGILGAGDALLGVMIVDPRETQLHAGICVGGAWRWIQ